MDGNFITAQGWAYVEFAVELARQMGLAAGDEAYQDGLRYLMKLCKPVKVNQFTPDDQLALFQL